MPETIWIVGAYMLGGLSGAYFSFTSIKQYIVDKATLLTIQKLHEEGYLKMKENADGDLVPVKLNNED